MRRLLARVTAPHPLDDGNVVHPHMSIGLTEIQDDEEIEHAVHRADTAMYRAKADGGDRVQVAWGRA